MPTYEFRCANGHEFEQFHRRISDAPATVECPQCGALAERKVSGGAGLLFKGSGFYLTDYGKNAHRKSAPSGGDGAASSARSDGGTKSDGGSTGGASSGAAPSPSSGASSAGGSASGGASGPKSE